MNEESKEINQILKEEHFHLENHQPLQPLLADPPVSAAASSTHNPNDLITKFLENTDASGT